MHLSRRGLLLGGGVRTLESFEPSALASLCRVERGDLRPFGDGFGVEYLACAWLAREVRHLHLTRLASEEHVTQLVHDRHEIDDRSRRRRAGQGSYARDRKSTRLNSSH